jgi:hypothetical protein
MFVKSRKLTERPRPPNHGEERVGRESNFRKWPINFGSGLVDIETSLYDLLPLAHGPLRSGYVVTCAVSAPF